MLDFQLSVFLKLTFISASLQTVQCMTALFRGILSISALCFNTPFQEIVLTMPCDPSSLTLSPPPPPGIFLAFLSPAVVFFKSKIFRKFLSGKRPECQTVWFKIRPDVLSDLIWVQTLSKKYQQTTLLEIKSKQNQQTKREIQYAIVASSCAEPGVGGVQPPAPLEIASSIDFHRN